MTDTLPTCNDYGLIKSYDPDLEFRAKYLRMDEEHPEIKAMCIEVELWMRRVLFGDKEKRLLVLAGRRGVGKSTVARRAIRAIQLLGIAAWYEGFNKKSPSAMVFEWSTLSLIGPMDRNERSCWIDSIESACILLDDIGTEIDKFGSAAPIENLRLILEARRHLWTICTTNVPPEKWAEAWDKRIEDRLYRNAQIVEIKTAPSYLRR